MLTIDNRCSDRACANKNIYRMVGACTNCGTYAILVLNTEGHEARGNRKCPVCACHSVRQDRLATPDEFPAA